MTIVNILTMFYAFIMISYAPFWRTLKQSEETTYSLINRHHISSATIDRLRKNGGISTATVDDLCRILHCGVDGIMEYRESGFTERR